MKRLLSFYSAFLLLAIFGVSSALATGTAPSQQARYITFSNVQSTSATIGWINGNGTGRMVVAYTGAVTDPTELATTYSVNDVIGTTGTVVFKGTARKVDVSGLNPATTYTVKVYEYATDGTIKTTNGTLNPRTVTTQAAAEPAVATVLGTFDGLADATGTAYAGGPLVGLKWNQVAGHNNATSWNLTIQKYNGAIYEDVATYANLDLGTLEDATTESYIAYLTPGTYKYSVQAVQGATTGAWSAYSTAFDVTYANVTTNDVLNVQSVSNTPVVITINNVFPTIVAEDNILTDAKLTFTGANLTVDSKIEKITYAEGGTVLGTITDADGYTLTDGTVYFSAVLAALGETNIQTPLIGHSGKNITWTITISGLVAGTYTAEVTPVAYTDATTKANEGNLAAADAFSITMANETVPAITPVQTMCGNAVVNFDITYPAIVNVDPIVKNNAILKATPALPEGTVVKWSYEGVYAEGKDYTVTTADQHETSTPGVYDYTEIPLSTITSTSATLDGHGGRTDNWSFTIVNADLADEDYTLEVSNVAQIGTTNYEYNNSTVVIKGLPTTTSGIDIAPVSTITNTPAVIYENINFNGDDLSGYDESILTDALIHSNTAFPAGAKIISVKSKVGENWFTIPMIPYALTAGETNVLLSTILGVPASPLQDQNDVIDWEITIVSPVAYTATVDLTPIVYTTAPTFGETPTGCYTAIGDADEFDLAFVNLDKTGVFAQLKPDAQNITNNKATFTFDIKYPAISGIATSVKNNAILECRPAVPNGTVIAWTYEGSTPEATYAVNATEDNGTDEGGTYTKIWLSKIVNLPAADLLQHNGREDNWTFEVRGTTEFAAKSYDLSIANVSYVGETLPTLPADIYTYNTTTASITGVLRVALSAIGNVKAVVGTPIILTQTATYQTIENMDETVLTDAILSTTTGTFPVGMSISKVTYQDGEGTQVSLPLTTETNLAGKSSVYLSEILAGGAAPLVGHSDQTITWNFYITGADNVTTDPIPVKITPISYVSTPGTNTVIGNEVTFNVEYDAADITATEQVNTFCSTAINYDITYPLMANIDSRVKNNAVINCFDGEGTEKNLPDSTVIKWRYNNGSENTYMVSGNPNQIVLSDITGVQGVPMFAHSGNTYNWDFVIEGLDKAEDYTFTITNIAEIQEETGADYTDQVAYETISVEAVAIPTVTQNEITNISTIINTPVIVSANVVYTDLDGLVDANILLDEKISTTYTEDEGETVAFPDGLTITKLVYHNGANDVETVLNTPYSLDDKNTVYLTDILGTPAVPYLSESGSNVTFDVVIESTGLTAMTIPVTIQTVAYTTKPTGIETDCEKELGTTSFNVVYNTPDFTVTEGVSEVCAGGDITFTLNNTYPTIDGMNSAVKATGAITSDKAIPAGTQILWSFNDGAATGIYPVVSEIAVDAPLYLDEIVGNSANLVALSANSEIPETWDFNITGLTAGVYNLTLKGLTKLDTKYYDYDTETLTVTVNAIPTLVIGDITVAKVSACATTDDGTITVADKGVGFEYSINNGTDWATSPVFTGKAVGPYNVKIKSASGCVSDAVEVSVVKDSITFTATTTAPSDYGANDGKITISGVTGGVAPFTYAITNVNTTTYKPAGPSLEFTELTEGIYYVKAIDANGCEKESAAQTIVVSGDLTVTDFLPVNATTVAATAPFKLTFNKNVTRGTSGAVKIYNATGNVLLESIQYNDISKITISGKVVTISHNALPAPGSFYVIIDGTVFRDIANNPYAGISTTTGWTFHTAFATPAAVENLRRITNNKTSITIAYDKPANVNVLVLALDNGGTGATTNAGAAVANYDADELTTAGALTDPLNAAMTAPILGGTGSLQNYKKVYAGTAAQVKVTGISPNTWTRFYVITYANDGLDDQFSTAVRTLDYKTNRFKDGVEGDNETPTAFGVSAIAPNPVSDMINFTVDAVETSEFTYTVYSMTGETLYTMNQVLTAGTNKASIATSKLGEVAAGTYLLRIANGSDETMVPFVIVK